MSLFFSKKLFLGSIYLYALAHMAAATTIPLQSSKDTWQVDVKYAEDGRLKKRIDLMLPQKGETTVHELKKLINEKDAPYLQVLYQAKLLSDEQTLKEMGVPSKSTMVCLCRKKKRVHVEKKIEPSQASSPSLSLLDEKEWIKIKKEDIRNLTFTQNSHEESSSGIATHLSSHSHPQEQYEFQEWFYIPDEQDNNESQEWVIIRLLSALVGR